MAHPGWQLYFWTLGQVRLDACNKHHDSASRMKVKGLCKQGLCQTVALTRNRGSVTIWNSCTCDLVNAIIMRASLPLSKPSTRREKPSMRREKTRRVDRASNLICSSRLLAEVCQMARPSMSTQCVADDLPHAHRSAAKFVPGPTRIRCHKMLEGSTGLQSQLGHIQCCLQDFCKLFRHATAWNSAKRRQNTTRQVW